MTPALAPQPAAEYVEDALDCVLSNDGRADGGPLAAVLVAGPTHGTLTLNADGSYVYVPDAGYVGPDEFTYRATYGTETSDVATVRLDVTNVRPTAPSRTFWLHAGETYEVGAPGMDDQTADPGDWVQYVLEAGPTHGTLSFPGDGTFVYVPDAGFVGDDSFVYHTFDGAWQSDHVGTITLRVENRVPEGVADSFDLASSGVSGAVLGNDVDWDGDALTAELLSGPAFAASFSLSANGTFSYVPTPGHLGADSFTYRPFDGTQYGTATTVALNTAAVPVGHDDDGYLPASGTLSVPASAGVLANDFSPDGSALTAVLEQGPTAGTLTLDADGGYSYVPLAQGQPAAVTFSYRPLSAAGLGALAFVQIKKDKAAFALREVTFPNAIAFAPDTTGEPAHVLNWSAARAQAREPLGYVRNSTPQMAVSIAVANPADFQQTRGFQVRAGDASGLVLFEATGDLKDGAVVIPRTAMLWNLGSKVRLADHWDVVWEVRAPGSAEWVAAGTSRNSLYVLLDAPAKRGMKRSLARLGSLGGEGKQTQDDFVRGVMAQFTTLENRKANGQLLTYWKNWLKPWGLTGTPGGTLNGNTANLLQESDGNCESWTRMFFDVLRAHGVTFTDNIVFVRSKKGDEQLFVKEWTAGVAAPKAPVNGYPYLNRAATYKPYVVVNKAYRYGWAVNPPGVAHDVANSLNAQASKLTKAPPLASFKDHALAKLTVGGKTVLFDPSYGKLYESNLAGNAVFPDLLGKLDTDAIAFYAVIVGKSYNLALKANPAGLDLERFDARRKNGPNDTTMNDY